MNLTEEKKMPLREQTVVNKKKMLMMHYKKSSNVSLHSYIKNTNFFFVTILNYVTIIVLIYRREIKIKFVTNLQNIYSIFHNQI